MLRAWKRRLAHRALSQAARAYNDARNDFTVPLCVAIARMMDAQAAMNRATRRLIELR